MGYIQEIRRAVGHQPLIMTSASGALLNDRQEVLLQQRADTGGWGFPGGYMEYGEAFTDTLRREFKEDAGMSVTLVKQLALLDRDFYTYPNGDQVQPINAFFLVKAVSDQQLQPKLSETVQTSYFALDGEGPRFFNNQHQKMWTILQNFVKNN